MLGISYLKSPATDYVIHYKKGNIKQHGQGLSFFYFAPTSVISIVPISSVDVPFAFTEVSSDFQDVTVQGTMTYRVADALQLATLLNYTVNKYRMYQSDDPTKLGERLVQTALTGARQYIQAHPLREVLRSAKELESDVTTALRNSATMTQLGVEVLEVSISSIKPNPEMAKALQAEAREELLREADEAIYARRNKAIELERAVREQELATDKMVVERNRDIQETKMDGQIAIEQQRSKLVETKVENERIEAEAKGAALNAVLGPVRELDWRMLMALQGGENSNILISAAFEELAKKADKIGQLNITPDLLNSLLKREEY
ncbi:MAG: SPFH domain-containing protein [Planctomycetaceae bacterium]|nr:SPFH domain-containing protein [Planctomycetaceae bacterium]